MEKGIILQPFVLSDAEGHLDNEAKSETTFSEWHLATSADTWRWHVALLMDWQWWHQEASLGEQHNKPIRQLIFTSKDIALCHASVYRVTICRISEIQVVWKCREKIAMWFYPLCQSFCCIFNLPPCFFHIVKTPSGDPAEAEIPGRCPWTPAGSRQGHTDLKDRQSIWCCPVQFIQTHQGNLVIWMHSDDYTERRLDALATRWFDCEHCVVP